MIHSKIIFYPLQDGRIPRGSKRTAGSLHKRLALEPLGRYFRLSAVSNFPKRVPVLLGTQNSRLEVHTNPKVPSGSTRRVQSQDLVEPLRLMYLLRSAGRFWVRAHGLDYKLENYVYSSGLDTWRFMVLASSSNSTSEASYDVANSTSGFRRTENAFNQVLNVLSGPRKYVKELPHTSKGRPKIPKKMPKTCKKSPRLEKNGQTTNLSIAPPW